ncbi:aspartate 1-decarboxylase [Neobacillus sp. SAB-20_R2A]|uniref:aspartate 1-decarboxylase n=1 Tax=Neobacillus sp. SAB-20_R2A TaxID=3120519 RepID=UPI003C6E487D
MMRTMLNAKLHRATVTDANLNYVGSITIYKGLLEQVDILPNEKVQVVNLNNGARFETYVLAGEKEGEICLNGAAARLVEKDDIVIIMSYVMVAEENLASHQPKIAILDENNRISQLIR